LALSPGRSLEDEKRLLVRKKSLTVQQLADASALDVDEVLLGLWDAGFEQLNDPDDLLRPNEVEVARRTLGLPSAHDLVRLAYWSKALDQSELELQGLLRAAGFRLTPQRKTIPKGAVSFLRKVARRSKLVDTPRIPPPPVPIPQEKIAPLEWRTVGHEREVRMLASEEVERIHFALVEDFARAEDPIVPSGVRDRNLLESAIFRQATSLGEIPKYPSVEMAAAALLHSIVHNHPFHNGNKRTGLVGMLVLLDENGLMLTCDEDTLFKLVLRVAQHQVVPRTHTELADREALWIANWIEANSRSVEKGERPLQWRKLKRVLAESNCSWIPASVGNRLNLTRRIEGRTRLGFKTLREFSTQVKYLDDGREAPRHVIHKIRRDLELDEGHGIDSASFYESAPKSVDDFIIHYRKTLRRLAAL
jgi:death-on-curing family protein